MIPDEEKHKWATQPIKIEDDHARRGFEVVRMNEAGTDAETMIFVPQAAFIAIVKHCKENCPYVLEAANE